MPTATLQPSQPDQGTSRAAGPGRTCMPRPGRTGTGSHRPTGGGPEGMVVTESETIPTPGVMIPAISAAEQM
jgi:hypothetical protein